MDRECDALNTDAHAAEHCAVDEQLLDRLGTTVGAQLLVRRSGDRLALYTVAASVRESRRGIVLGVPGLRRLDPAASPAEGFRATVHPSFTGGDDKASARLTEQIMGEAARGLAILAPHGGNIEPGTGEQALAAYDALAALGKPVRGWIARGFKPGGGAHRCWHITSTEISERSFPELARLIGAVGSPGAFAHAVALHGHDDSAAIVVGGGLPADASHTAPKSKLASRIHDALKQVMDRPPTIEVRLDGPLSGVNPRNIVNRATLTGGGLQIEQPPAVRRDTAQQRAVARAIAELYVGRPHLSLNPPRLAANPRRRRRLRTRVHARQARWPAIRRDRAHPRRTGLLQAGHQGSR